MRIPLVLILLGSLLSGCTSLDGDGPTLATAQDAQGPADRSASRWADDAVLVGASAIEFDDEARREGRDELSDRREELKEARNDGELEDSEYDNLTKLLDVYDTIIAADSDIPGDGLAAVWFYAYYSASEDAPYSIAVSKGKVIYAQAGEEAADNFDVDSEGEPLVDWRVDSDDAAETAALGNTDYTTLCAAKNVIAFTILAQGDNGPVWFIGVDSSDPDQDPDEVFVAVDAVNGSLVRDEVVDPVEEILFQESGSMDGDLFGSASFTTSDTFEVLSEGHLALAIHVSISLAPPQPVEVTITAPDGASERFTVGGSDPFLATGFIVLDAVPVGVYEVELSVPLSLASRYDISWCTDGEPTAQGEFQERACDFVEESGASSAASAASRGETLSRLHRWAGAW